MEYKEVVQNEFETSAKNARNTLSLYERTRMTAEHLIGDKDEAEVFIRFIKEYYGLS